ncbi:MAG: peptidase C11 [Bacteroides sp.]|nr:peptidase C11 [Bacteroides sp.]
MKYFYYLLFLCFSGMAITACGEDDPVLPEDIEGVVLVYMAADNTLSTPFPAWDYEEMKVGMENVSSAMRLLIYMDTGKSPRLIELKNQNGKVVETVVKSYETRNSVGVSETKEVFNEVFSKYSADRYGLVYWSHADGWMPFPLTSSQAGTRWIGQDKGGGDYRMNLSDFVSVVESAPHFDFILMDACFASSVEVVYALRQCTDYYMGSPTETPGPGAPYDKIVPLMFADGNAAKKMAEAYFNVYNNLYNGGIGLANENWTGGVSLCVIKTAALEQLATATCTALQGVDCSIGELRRQVFDYDKRSTTYVGYFDMADMMKQLVDEDTYVTWSQSFEATNVYWNTTSKNYSGYFGMFSMTGANGISHYIPRTGTSTADVAYRSTAWYEAAGLSALGW